MKTKAVIVDENLKEQVHSQNGIFPIVSSTDYFDDYINGEVNCHWHDEVEFGIVLKGEVEYSFCHHAECPSPQILHEGEGVFVNVKALHMAQQKIPGTVMFSLLFPTEFFSSLPNGTVYQKDTLPVIRHPFSGLHLIPVNETDREILDILRLFYQLTPDTLGYELLCIEKICRIWRQLLLHISETEDLTASSKSDSLQEQRIRTMLLYIHKHYPENISISTISRAANISRSECFRCFKNIVRKSPQEYLTEYRLSKAAQLLTNTDASNLDICCSCGFSGQSYFGKLFKEKYGISPRQFRERALKLHQKPL